MESSLWKRQIYKKEQKRFCCGKNNIETLSLLVLNKISQGWKWNPTFCEISPLSSPFFFSHHQFIFILFYFAEARLAQLGHAAFPELSGGSCLT